MSAAELDLGTLRRLAPVTDAGQVSVLLGAGGSAAAGLRDWDGLATQLLQLSGTIDDEETARAFRRLTGMARHARGIGILEWSRQLTRSRRRAL